MAEKVTTMQKATPAPGKNSAADIQRLRGQMGQYMTRTEQTPVRTTENIGGQNITRTTYEDKVVNDPELLNQQNKAELSRLNREVDMIRGAERGRELFGDGSLSQVDPSRRSGDMSEIIAARQDAMRNGMGADAFQAAREARLGGLQRSEQSQARQLRASQAAQGVTGPMAQAQSMALLGQQQDARQGAERQLLLDNVAQKTQALGLAEQSIASAEGTEKAEMKGERMGQLTTMMGEAALGAQERGAAIQSEAAKAYASAAAQQSGGGKK